MKSFNQFLNESYFSEERPAKKARSGSPSYAEVKAAQDAKEAEKAAKKAARGPTGAAADSSKQFQPKGTTTTVPGSSVRGETGKGGALAVRTSSSPSAPVGSPSNPQRIYPTPVKGTSTSTPSAQKGGALATRPAASPAPTQEIKPVSVKDITSKPKALPSAGKISASKAPTLGKTVNPKSLGAVKPRSPKGKFPSGLGRNLGRAAYGLEAGLETLDQKSRGRKTGSAVAMGVTKAAGGWAGAKAGAAAGGALGSLAGPVGTGVGAALGGVGGYMAGSGLAGKASETVAGATGKEKSAMATTNRQRQAGSAVKGIGGPTSFSQRKPGGPAFISTGVGKQRRTAQLARTGVVQRGGQSVAGNLAFKNGQAVYKAPPRPGTDTRNPLEGFGRLIAPSAYKKSDAANAARNLARARSSDAAVGKKLGVKKLPGK